MTDKVHLSVVTEWREMRIALGEGGAPAQRTLHGVEFYRDGDGNNVAERPVSREVTAEEAATYVESTAFALHDALVVSNERLADERTTTGELRKSIAVKDRVIEAYANAEARWASDVADAVAAHNEANS